MESGISALLIIGSPLILLYVWLAIKMWLEKSIESKIANEYTECKLNYPYNEYTEYEFIYPHKNNHTEVKNSIINKKRKSSLRKRPPNASFFGRLDGKKVSIEGPYEEKFLNGIEATKWKLKQKYKELKSMEG